MGKGSVVPDKSGEQNVKSLFDALDEIQQYASAESMLIDKDDKISDFFTLSQKIEFYTVGFKHIMGSFLVSVFFHPIFFTVINEHLSLFGDGHTTLFDKFYVSLLSFGFVLGYIFFFSWITKFNKGILSASMIKTLISGVISGAIMKAILGFFIFNALYFVAITPERIWETISWFQGLLNPIVIERLYNFCMIIRETFPSAALFMVFNGMLYLIIISFSFIYYDRKRRKMEYKRDLLDNI
jgi:hypothetical protein